MHLEWQGQNKNFTIPSVGKMWYNWNSHMFWNTKITGIHFGIQNGTGYGTYFGSCIRVKHSVTPWSGTSTPINLRKLKPTVTQRSISSGFIHNCQNKTYWKYSSTRECIIKQWHTCAMEYYPAVKRKTLSIQPTAQMNFKYIMPNKASQK